MKDGELLFIATPAMGHLVAQVELARHLVAHHPGISISILIPKTPVADDNLNAYLRSALHEDDDRISITELPPLENAPSASEWISGRPFARSNLLANLYKPVVKRVVETRRQRTLGIITDMVNTQFVHVAEELGVPSYVLLTSGANTLAMMLRLESIGVDAPSAFGDLSPESAPLEFPGYRNPVPIKVWPEIFLNKAWSAQLLGHATAYRRANGILVNTFAELESDLLLSLAENEDIPPVYPVGPILHMGRPIKSGDPTLAWLAGQPPCSVVFLCFGSYYGCFSKEQIEEIAGGIERSGHRFLWSLRRQPIREKGESMPTDYEDFNEVLPKGFLERTREVGRMIGWAPQAEVLAHPAVGAFVSHCGWNSVLESLLFGVPVVTWPMYAEQQLNAFSLVRELGLAVELRMDYRYNVEEMKGSVEVLAADVEAVIRRMMEAEEGVRVRKKTKEMSQLAKKALDAGGSSNKSLHLFIEDVMKNPSS